MSLLSLLTQSMSSQSSVNSLAKKTGISDAAAKMIVSAAIPLLLKSLTKNASSQNGAASLLGALGQHTSTKALPQQIEEADTEDGTKIIGHIFGDSKDDVVNQLSQQTGLDSSQVSSVLGNMAPALLSSISAATAASQTGQKPQQKPEQLQNINIAPAQTEQPVQSLGSSPVQSLGGSQQQSSGGLGGLLSGLFGGGSSEAPQQAQQQEAPSGLGLLGSLMGGGNANANEAPSASSGLGLLGSILGGGSGSGDDLMSSLLGGSGGDLLGSLLGGSDGDDDGSSLLNSLLGIKF